MPGEEQLETLDVTKPVVSRVSPSAPNPPLDGIWGGRSSGTGFGCSVTLCCVGNKCGRVFDGTGILWGDQVASPLHLRGTSESCGILQWAR